MDGKVFALLEKMYSEMQTGFSKTNDRLDKIENKILKIDSKLDNEMNSKIESLFDGYKQNTEINQRIETKLDDLTNKVERQEVEIRVIKGGK
ncbi:hypothetical protein QBE52_02840 [Clostridiaceae bacterium 35-E11]